MDISKEGTKFNLKGEYRHGGETNKFDGDLIWLPYGKIVESINNFKTSNLLSVSNMFE